MKKIKDFYAKFEFELVYENRCRLGGMSVFILLRRLIQEPKIFSIIERYAILINNPYLSPNLTKS